MKIALILDGVVSGFYIEQSEPDYLSDPRGRYKVVPAQYENDVAIGWIVNGETWEAPPAPPVPADNFGRLITVLAYSSRFTQAETIAIELAAQGTGATAAAAANLLRRLGWAAHIFLDDPRTVSETNALEAAGFIGVGRAAEIIGDPVYSNEVIKEARIAYGLSLIPTAHELSQNGGKGYAAPSEVPNG